MILTINRTDLYTAGVFLVTGAIAYAENYVTAAKYLGATGALIGSASYAQSYFNQNEQSHKSSS